MKTFINKLPLYASYAFILLFTYAAGSKMFDFENFQVQLAQSPLLSAYAGFISYAVIILELVIVGLLCFNLTRLWGLLASFAIMVAFTVYIYLILNYSDFVPCSCGGILEKMSWTEHLIFNIGCVVMAGLAIIATYPITPKAPIMEVTEEDWMANYWQRRKDRRMIAYQIVMLLVLPASLMVALFFSSEHIMKKENNFTRRFPPHPVMEDQSYDLTVNSFYFAGFDEGDVYLGNSSSPFRIFKMDETFRKVDTIDLQPEKDVAFKNLKYLVQDQMLYAYDGSVPVIYASKIDSLNYPLKAVSKEDVFFDQLVPVSQTQYFLRIEEFLSKRTGVAYLSVRENQRVKISNTLLTLKADGGFHADGKLLYDTELHQAYYLFYYRNQILQFNSDLTLTKEMKTIDPVREANLEVIKMKDGRTKIKGPSSIVNRNMVVHRGLIFNEANLMGKHESKELWTKNAVVDVYQTPTATYWGSFYIPHRGKEKMFQMMMTDNYFYILSGNEIVRYRCAQTLTDNFIEGSSRKP